VDGSQRQSYVDHYDRSAQVATFQSQNFDGYMMVIREREGPGELLNSVNLHHGIVMRREGVGFVQVRRHSNEGAVTRYHLIRLLNLLGATSHGFIPNVGVLIRRVGQGTSPCSGRIMPHAPNLDVIPIRKDAIQDAA
jgi:hypothetical protein